MKKIVLSILLLSAVMIANAQTEKVYAKDGYKLTLTNNDTTLDTAELTRLVKTFFIVYPKLAAEYNPGTLKEVKMAVDTAYKGVAATADGKVTIASSWLHKRPEDIDVVTHEVMHIVQDYGESVGPGWLTEGIADYARNKLGVNNPAAKWSLPEFKPNQNYDNAYRVTARFLYWIEEKKKPGIVKELDSQMRKHTYTDNAWKQLTGKTVDELWKEYAANPAI
ncbi:MAG: basic secretory protein-like protein [Bacteroidota bacterium]